MDGMNGPRCVLDSNEKEASEQRGIGAHRVSYYCMRGRIPGALKIAGVRLVPKVARKPKGMRKSGRLGEDAGGNDESE